MIVVGIDPGGRGTGLVVRRNKELLDHKVVRRVAAKEIEIPDDIYLRSVLGQITYMLDNIAISLREKSNIAVELVQAPKVFYKEGKPIFVKTESLIAVSMVFGAVISRFDCLLVKPNKNGSRGKENYPDELWGEREGPKGTGILRHARSAWDVAGDAIEQLGVYGKNNR